MSVKGAIKEAAGFIQEETGEQLNDKEMQYDGRKLRNEGRAERDVPKPPKLTEPGTGHKED